MPRRIRERVIDPDREPEEWTLALRASNLPDRYWTASADRINDHEVRSFVDTALREAKVWLARGEGFFLHGPCNTGKSSVAAILFMEAVRRAERALWLPIRDVPSARFHDTEDGRRLGKRLATADVVMIDDIGSEGFKLSGPAGAALEAVVRTAYDRERSISFTSNLSWTDFQARYSSEIDPLVSVIRRLVRPVAITNRQWPDVPGVPRG